MMSYVRNPIFLIVAAGALIFALFALIRTMTFLARAEKTVGVVSAIDSYGGRCGGGRRRRSYPCTKYRATISYESASGGRYTLSDSAGSCRQGNEATYRPSYQLGQRVKVRYLPSHPEEARIDSVFGIFGTEFISLFVGLFSTFASFAKSRQRSFV